MARPRRKRTGTPNSPGGKVWKEIFASGKGPGEGVAAGGRKNEGGRNLRSKRMSSPTDSEQQLGTLSRGGVSGEWQRKQQGKGA